MPGNENLRICVTCGTQFDIPGDKPLEECRMCLDPRQFIPPTGHSFTTLAEMRGKYENQIQQDGFEKRMWSIWTEPAFAIGERAIFLQTEGGNVLWDCVANLDQKTVDFINSKGGVKAMVVSHPHFYTSMLDWAQEFNCPLYLASDEAEWICREDKENRIRWIKDLTQEVVPGVTAVKVGGHFPGSLILHWDGKIFTADTIAVTLSGIYRKTRPEGANTFSFMWAYPNFIPLAPSVLQDMWKRLEPFEFYAVHSLFVGRDVRDARIKGAVLEDMKLQARFQGYEDHPIFKLQWDGREAVMPEVEVNGEDEVAGPPKQKHLERGF